MLFAGGNVQHPSWGLLLQNFQVGLAHEPRPLAGIEGEIRLHRLAALQAAAFHDSAGDGPLQPILPALDGEVGERNLPRVARHHGRHAKVVSGHLLAGNVKLVVSTIVQLLPLQLVISALDDARVVVSSCQGDVGTVWTGRGDGRAGKLDTNTAFTSSAVVGLLVEPYKVADPRRVTITGQEDVVADVVAIQVVQRAVLVAHVAVPRVVVERVLGSVGGRLVEPTEDNL